MRKNTMAFAIVPLLLFILMPSVSFAHGERHAGGHRTAWAKECVYPIQKRGLMGMGFWENPCSYGVHVKWNLIADGPGGGCGPRPGEHLPCMTYVAANSRTAATVSDNAGRGKLNWIACRAKDTYSDPWPMVVRVRADGSAEYNCFHTGFGPNNKVVSKVHLERSLVRHHANIRYSVHEYKKQKWHDATQQKSEDESLDEMDSRLQEDREQTDSPTARASTGKPPSPRSEPSGSAQGSAWGAIFWAIADEHFDPDFLHIPRSEKQCHYVAGMAWNHETKREAMRSARDLCRKEWRKSGTRARLRDGDCGDLNYDDPIRAGTVLGVVFGPGQCAAYAKGRHHDPGALCPLSGSGVDASESEAARKAVADCESLGVGTCRVEISACNNSR